MDRILRDQPAHWQIAQPAQTKSACKLEPAGWRRYHQGIRQLHPARRLLDHFPGGKQRFLVERTADELQTERQAISRRARPAR
jgi:hypothetical protein